METQKSDYMLLFRGTNWDRNLSPDQLQKVISDWYSWFDGLIKEGKAVSGHPLMNEGKLVSAKNGRTTVADGPFAESKEAIGGYFYLHIDDMEEALAIAKNCPGLEFGVVVEVRPVADMCAGGKRVQEKRGQLAEAIA